MAVVMVGAIELRRGSVEAARSVMMVALFFIVPIAVLMLLQVRRGTWGNVDASDRRERPLLYIVGGAALLALLGYITAYSPNSFLLRGGIGTLTMLVACAVITRWFKVSLHMASAGLATTALILLGSPVGWVIAIVLPVLAWSRLALARHTLGEIALGLLLGVATGTAIYLV